MGQQWHNWLFRTEIRDGGLGAHVQSQYHPNSLAPSPTGVGLRARHVRCALSSIRRRSSEAVLGTSSTRDRVEPAKKLWRSVTTAARYGFPTLRSDFDALDQPFAGTARPSRISERPVTGAADSGRQFVRARRHTLIVRTLRFVLPIIAVGVVGIYVASAMSSLDLVGKLAQLPIPTITPENVTMDNPRYEGFSGDGGSYVVRARTARQDFKQTELIHLNEISGEMIDSRKVRTEMSAASGVFHTKTNVLDLLGGIEISSNDGMAGKLASATVFAKRGVILSKEPSTLKMRQGEISSNQLMIWQKKRKVMFVGDVKTRLTPPASENTSGSPEAGENAGNTTQLIGSSNEPVDIASNLVRVEDLKSTASFVGQVQAVQGDQVLHSERLDVFYENQDGAPARQAGIPGAGNGRVTRMVSLTPIVITRGDTERITADSLDVNAIDEVAVLTGNVEMASGQERSARSDVAEIDARNDTALLTGDVVVTQGPNEVRGGRLLINRKLGTSHLASPATPGQPEGRILAKLQRDGRAAGNTGAQPGNDAGTMQGMTVGTFKTDPDAPVNVEADELTVSEVQKTVQFTGDVRAVQGGFSIRTSRLIAHYTGGASLLDPAGQDSETSGDSSGAQLTRISAREKVLVSSSGGQSATGDWAEFDVAGNTVTLGGDVVITQGKNIVRGTRLKIDMTSGNSMIETAPEAAGAGWASTMQPKGGAAKPVAVPGGVAARGGRPSAVFYPTQFKQKNGGKQSGQSSGSGGADASSDSWGATTAPN